MADLTRFDFNAYNFLNSETVESMTDAEAGQYILLLAKSWVLAKGASLPDDPELLAKWAHCRKISDKVLGKFPVVNTEFGSRRRNDVLYKEWVSALNRTQVASESGRVGAAMRWGGYSDPISTPNGENIAQTNHTKPNQTNPSQANPADMYKQCKSIFRQKCHGNLKSIGSRGQQWVELVDQHGDLLIQAFKIWAEEGGVRLKTMNWPIAVFLKNVEEYIEAAQIQKVETETQATTQESAEAELKTAQEESAKEREGILERIRENEETAARIAKNPEAALFGVTSEIN